MNIFTASVLDKGNFITTHRGWSFSHSNRSGREEFNIPDLDNKTRFFDITSLQPIGDGMVYDGFFKKEFLSLAKDEHPEVNRQWILVALVVDGQIDIPESCFKKHMVKSRFLHNSGLTTVVVHMKKTQRMSFCVRDGNNRIVRILTMMYNNDHHCLELCDHSKEIVVNDSSSLKSHNPFTRLLVRAKSLFLKINPTDPRTVR